MEFLMAVVLTVGVTIALITDFKTGLIYNWNTVPIFLFGLAFAFYSGGWSAAGSAFMAGLFTFVTTFKFSAFGGGDFKLALAVGTCLGWGGWPIYFVGMGLCVVILSLIVKLKIYTVRGFFRGIKCELATGQYAPARNNFAVFEKAAQKAGYTGTAPTTVGALRVAAGVYTYLIFLFGGQIICGF